MILKLWSQRPCLGPSALAFEVENPESWPTWRRAGQAEAHEDELVVVESRCSLMSCCMEVGATL